MPAAIYNESGHYKHHSTYALDEETLQLLYLLLTPDAEGDSFKSKVKSSNATRPSSGHLGPGRVSSMCHGAYGHIRCIKHEPCIRAKTR